MQLSDLLRYGDNSKVFVMLNNIKSKLANQYFIEGCTIYLQLENAKDEKIKCIGDIRDLAEKECINNPNDWGSLYTSPMEEIENCQLGILKNTMNIKRDEEAFIIEDYKIMNISTNYKNDVIIEIEEA